MVEPFILFEDGRAEEAVVLGEGDQLRPQGDGQRQQIAHKAPFQPVPGLCLSNRGKGRPGAPPQGEQEKQLHPHQRPGESPVEGGILDDPPHHRGGGENVRGHVDGQQDAGQDPAQPEPPVLPPQGPVAQVQQGGPQQGQDILEVEELKPEGGQPHAPQNFGHGGAPGGIGLHLAGGGGELGQVLHQRAVKFVGTHRTSPPNCFWSFLRMRYSFPSTARSVRPSSAAIRAVDWR